MDSFSPEFMRAWRCEAEDAYMSFALASDLVDLFGAYLGFDHTNHLFIGN